VQGARFFGGVLAIAVLAGAGCVRRTLTVRSDPPGALLYLNGLEVGRTPVTRDFTWYGTYDVTLRHEGYEPLKTQGKVIAPWWQWVPIDLVAELLPLHDNQFLHYVMKPEPSAAAEPDVMLRRAQELRGEMESSPRTPAPPPPAATTRPVPATRSTQLR
jgi:hypothetical protein